MDISITGTIYQPQYCPALTYALGVALSDTSDCSRQGNQRSGRYFAFCGNPCYSIPCEEFLFRVPLSVSASASAVLSWSSIGFRPSTTVTTVTGLEMSSGNNYCVFLQVTGFANQWEHYGKYVVAVIVQPRKSRPRQPLWIVSRTLRWSVL